MSKIKPRFEFRAFAQEFGIVERRIRELTPVEKIRESSEIYIMSRKNNENNTKIRDNLMDIKVFIQRKKGLEQWNPRIKASFPMNIETICEKIFPAFAVSLPEFKRDTYTLTQYLNEIIKPHPDLQAVHIFKRRFAFTINDCIAEIADVYINGAKIRTANLESVDLDAILEGMKMTTLDQYQNCNYLMAIKKVIGMENDIINW